MSSPDTAERLQKVLAAAGVASRRVAEGYIAQGRVVVDGRVAELGDRVTLDQRVEIDGTPVQLDTAKRYIVLNKPVGIVSSLADARGRPDLRVFTDSFTERLFNVGRLDVNTSGLLFLTNDGELANVLAHPSFGVEKTYVAKVRGRMLPGTLNRLRTGVELEDGLITADSAKLIDANAQTSLVELTIHSGRNHIVRRMLDAVGHPVLELVRRKFGPLRLGSLGTGQMREANSVELGALLTIVREAERARAQEERQG